jgi:hypothetical protein
MMPTITGGPARLIRIAAAAMVAMAVAGCSPADYYRESIVTGTFNGGKLIALNQFVGANTTSGVTVIEAYADVSDQTPGTLDISGPQHWRCAGLFHVPSDVPSPGLFDGDQDKALRLPSLVLTGMEARGVGFAGPPGTYQVTIEVPSLAARFSHTWKFLGPDSGPDVLSDMAPACTQILETLAQQRSFAGQCLSALQAWLDRASPSPTHTQLQALLDQAKQAKRSGDDRTNSDQRTADYQSAVTLLTKMVRLAGDSATGQLSRSDVYHVTKLATTAVALLSQTGLR